MMSHRPSLYRQAKSSSSVDNTSISPSSSDIKELIQTNKDVVRSIQSLKEEFDGFRRCVASLEEKVGKFESSLSSLSRRQSECANDIKDIKADIVSLKKSQDNLSHDILQEVEERERRRNNLMIFGLPESTDGSLSDRQEFDTKQISNLFKEGMCLESVEPEHSRRVGRIVDGRARPLKVRMEDQEDKQRVPGTSLQEESA